MMHTAFTARVISHVNVPVYSDRDHSAGEKNDESIVIKQPTSIGMQLYMTMTPIISYNCGKIIETIMTNGYQETHLR